MEPTKHLKTPGVYVEEISKLPPSIVQVETAIPAFIGYTRTAIDDQGRSLKLKPHRIASMLEYERFFGGADIEKGIVVNIKKDARGTEVSAAIDPKIGRSKFLMFYALQLFFANGGGPCWIVSTGDYEESGGVIAQAELKQGLAATAMINEITLYVFPDAQGLGSAADYYGVYKEAIDLCVKLGDRFTVTDVWNNPGLDAADWRENIDGEDGLRGRLDVDVAQGKYAASYFPNILTTLDLFYGGKGDGDGNVTVILNGEEMKLGELKARDNALYFQARAAIDSIPCEMPPSPAIVGIYASVDAARGVWKAPANVAVKAAVEPSILLTDQDQAGLNIDMQSGKSVNAIRYFTGKGILVWGARTLAGNDNEWRYVPVRRFFIMVEESAKNATQQFVFEPNDRNTWTRVRSMIENFLNMQWRAGALMGTTTAEAYYVRVGLNETMTEEDIWEGRMIVEIGMAAVRPAEFIIMQFSHKMLGES